ncbi:glycine cleavage system protein H [Deltaproteobacteria bacterium Smac51]|nr:glycine cleavage system protein H [Deltaproteobacteria bacterium Smac51]
MKELNELNLPTNVKYDADHEWVSPGAPCRIGISDFAQDALGDLTFVEMPEVGAELTKGEEFGTLESTKSVSPLMSPVDGKVTAVNEALSDDPGLVNRDPYGEGWIVEVELKNTAQIDTLMDAAAYKAHVEKESAEH